MKRIEYWHPTANGLWEPHPLRMREWHPVPGKETEAYAWLDAQRAELATFKARVEARKRARVLRLTDGPSAVLRTMAVGETRAMAAYKLPAQLSATVRRISILDGKAFTTRRDAALDCVTVTRVS